MSDQNQTQMPAVNEHLIKRIIEDAYLQSTGSTIVEKSYTAFRYLQKRRRTDMEWGNVELAAAEHYMYMRFLVGSTGDPVVVLAPRLYGLKKKLFFALDIDSLMTTSKYPCLPPSEDSVKWGEQGVRDGLVDFKFQNPATDFQVGNALKPLIQGSY